MKFYNISLSNSLKWKRNIKMCLVDGIWTLHEKQKECLVFLDLLAVHWATRSDTY